MLSNKNKFLIAAAIIACICLFFTCNTGNKNNEPEPALQDTIFLNQWRREKAERIRLSDQYEHRLTELQMQNDSLRMAVIEKKQLLQDSRKKADLYREQLKQVISRTDTNTIVRDTIKPVVDSLIYSTVQSDTACDVTIATLENSIANRDSTIKVSRQMEGVLRDLQKEEELRNQYLTEQLNLAFKTQKKKSRQNKLLTGGILILSGIATSLFIINSTK